MLLLLACADPAPETTDSSPVDDTAADPQRCGSGTVHLYGSFTLDGDTLTGVYGAIGVLDDGNPFDPTDHLCSAAGTVTATRATVSACSGCSEAWDIQNDDPVPVGEACAAIDADTWAYAAAPWTLGWYATSAVGSSVVEFYEDSGWGGFAGNLNDPTAWPTAVVERTDGLDVYTAIQETETTKSGDARVFELPCE